MPDALGLAIVLEPIDGLLAHPRNPREGDVDAIAESIRENGYLAPVVVQRSTRYVIDGNHRLLAARQLGMAEIPTVWVDVDDDTALRYLLAANRTNDLAAYDDQALTQLLAEIDGGARGLVGTGWQRDDLQALLLDLSDRESLLAPSPPSAPKPNVGVFPGHCPRCGYPDEAPASP